MTHNVARVALTLDGYRNSRNLGLVDAPQGVQKEQQPRLSGTVGAWGKHPSGSVNSGSFVKGWTVGHIGGNAVASGTHDDG